MNPRRRPPVDEPDLDNWSGPRLRVVVDEDPDEVAEQLPLDAEERAPVPLAALELAWSLDVYPIVELYVARSIELAGGFRPILDRAFTR